jgi:TctA family transporter
MLMSQGSLGIFFSNPLVSTITILATLLLVSPIITTLVGRARTFRVVRADAIE